MQSDGDILSDALSEEQEAIQLMRSGKLELARYRLAKLCKKYPQLAKFHFNYALVLYKLKNFEEALDEVNTGLWLKPDDIKATQFKQELLTRMAKSKPVGTSPPSRSKSTIPSSPPGLTKMETVEVQENESQPVPDDQFDTNSKPALDEEEYGGMTHVVENTMTSAPESIDHQEERQDANVAEIDSEAHPEETEIEEKEESQVTEHPPEPIQEDLVSEPAVKETEESQSTEHPPESIQNDLASEAVVKEIDLPQEFSRSFIENLKASLSSGSENQDEMVEPETQIQEQSVEMSSEAEIPPHSAEYVQLPTQEQVTSDTEDVDSSDVEIIDEASNPESKSDDVQIIDEIPEPKVIQEPVEVIEIEPRVTILEKAADVTVEHGELPATSSASTAFDEEQDGFKVEEVQGPLVLNASPAMEEPETEIHDTDLEVPSSRLINLRDLFKESKEKIMEACEAPASDTEQPSILHDIVDIEPFDESRLITFKTLKELKGYKYSIQALVRKYLDKKAERESSSEPASSTNVEMEKPLVLESSNEVVQATSQESIVSTDLVNIELDQEILGAMIDALDSTDGYPLQIDYKARIEADILEKINTNETGMSSINDGILAQIIDMKSYAEDIRLNRNIMKNKDVLVNDMLGNEIVPVLAEIESTTCPSRVYPSGKALDSGTFDMEYEFERLEHGDQLNFTEAALNEILRIIRRISEQSVDETGNEVDTHDKEILAKIKRTTHRLYENAQYEQALTIYGLIMSYFPEDFEVLFNTGFCYREMGNYPEGEAIFKRIIELFYDNAYAWYNLSLIYAFSNQGDKEAYCLEKAREFGYIIDINRLSRLNLAYTQKNPFDFD